MKSINIKLPIKMKIHYLILITVSLFSLSLNAQHYTLQDNDVVVENGVILSCSYNFEIKDIAIPQILDGQNVIAIDDAEDMGTGIFAYKGIESIVFPNTIEYIGDNAFERNNIIDLNMDGLSSLTQIGDRSFYDCNITILSLDGCSSLESIEDDAFSYNELTSLNLSHCTGLTDIGARAFFSNFIEDLQMEGCAALKTIDTRAFAKNSINTLDLSNCTDLRKIGFYTFNDNNISYLDISGCGQLTYISASAFNNNNITGITLPACIGYESYGWKDENDISFPVGSVVTDLSAFYYVAYTYTLKDEDVIVNDKFIQSCSYDFWFKSLSIPETLDGQTIKGIKDGEAGVYSVDGVFSNKDITDLHLPVTIEYIGDWAFSGNPLGDMDLSAFTKLEYIGEYGLTAGWELKLPVCSGYEELGWMDSEGQTYEGGEVILNHGNYLYVPYTYTLKDEDVIVENGVIKSCSYSFSHKEIIIPEVLQGQTIVGIDDAEANTEGVFAQKGITSISFPQTLEFIGSWAFYYNEITNLDFSDCNSLQSIGKSAFLDNEVTVLNLNNCTELKDIHDKAFHYHSLQQLDLSDCTALERIGNWAFVPGYNSEFKINNLDLSNCSNLLSINSYAFGGNEIENIDLSGCISLTFIDNNAFKDNILESFNLPVCEGYESFCWKGENGNSYTGGQIVNDLSQLYYVPYNYTLTNEDVVIEDGEIIECSYNFQFKSIIMPETLQGQTVTTIGNKTSIENNAFGGKELVKIQLPSTIEIIGDYAFSDNKFLSLDFNSCSELQLIGESAFCFTFKISELNLNGCESLDKISDYAFSGNYFEQVSISECNSLTYIGTGAFGENGPDSFQLPVCEEYESLGWVDNLGNSFMGGEIVPNWGKYFVPIPYTLKDFDVEIENGVIITCNHDLENMDIIIPDTLDNQQVVVIVDANERSLGVFASKGISSIVFPGSMAYIGSFAFSGNQLDTIYLEEMDKLRHIGANAFISNLIVEIKLPMPSYQGFEYWTDENENIYNVGENVSDLSVSYNAVGSTSDVIFNIKDSDESPIDDAEIYFYQHKINSDISGVASFQNVFSGQYKYQVSKSGFTTETGLLNISTNDTTAIVKLLNVGIKSYCTLYLPVNL